MPQSIPALSDFRRLPIFSSIVMVLVACSGDHSAVETQSAPSTIPANRGGHYYAAISESSPEALRASLQDVLESSHTILNYAEVWSALQYTDEDPNNTDNVILLCSGRSAHKTNRDGQPGADRNSWNREHVWPKSQGLRSKNQSGYTDIHHIRPTDKSVNRSRGSSDFDSNGDGQLRTNDTKADPQPWEPRDEVKGDIARMIFYMDVRYDGGDGGMPDLRVVNDTSSSPGQPIIGVLCSLYAWHWQDPVDDFEMRRNNRIQQVQGNRNPFVDHPEWAQNLWGDHCDR